jgi:hypothetical protein
MHQATDLGASDSHGTRSIEPPREHLWRHGLPARRLLVHIAPVRVEAGAWPGRLGCGRSGNGLLTLTRYKSAMCNAGNPCARPKGSAPAGRAGRIWRGRGSGWRLRARKKTLTRAATHRATTPCPTKEPFLPPRGSAATIRGFGGPLRVALRLQREHPGHATGAIRENVESRLGGPGGGLELRFGSARRTVWGERHEFQLPAHVRHRRVGDAALRPARRRTSARALSGHGQHRGFDNLPPPAPSAS